MNGLGFTLLLISGTYKKNALLIENQHVNVLTLFTMLLLFSKTTTILLKQSVSEVIIYVVSKNTCTSVTILEECPLDDFLSSENLLSLATG